MRTRVELEVDGATTTIEIETELNMDSSLLTNLAHNAMCDFQSRAKGHAWGPKAPAPAPPPPPPPPNVLWNGQPMASKENPVLKQHLDQLNKERIASYEAKGGQGRYGED